MPIKKNKDINELCEYIFRDEKINNSAFIYELLLYNNCLINILNEVDDKPVACNVNPNIVVTAEQQVICLLNRMINRFDSQFPFLHGYRKWLFTQFLGYEETRQYLLSKHYLGDNSYIKFFEDSINRIFVRNFYRNLEFIMDDFIDIFKERKINYKKLSLNRTTHLRQLVDLLSDFTYCYHDNINIIFLFESIEDRVNMFAKSYGRKKATKEVWYQRMIDENKIHTEEIIKAYNRKKAYLELFKK